MRRTFAIAACAAVLALVGCGVQPAEDPRAPGELSKLAGWKGAAVNSAGGFRFVVMSDRTGGHQPGLWAQAVEEINRLKPDFVICVGDLIEGYVQEEAQAVEMWKELDGLVRQLDAPFFYCPGNHDVEGPACRKVYTRLHGVDGKTYYSFDYRGCHFVVLDSTAIVAGDEKIAQAQWGWLETDLAAARGAEHVFLFEHHPLYGTPDWKRLRAILDADKTTIFSGHQHTLSYDEEDGVAYFVLGPTATQAAPAEREKGKFQMFAHVAVVGGPPAVGIVPLGQVLQRDFVGRAVPKRLAAIGRGIRLGATTVAGGEVALELSNPTDTAASYTLSWVGHGAWFADGLPKAETLTVRPGKSARRSYRIRPASPEVEPAALEVGWEISHKGVSGQRRRRLPLLVLPTLKAPRVRGITIDGRLDDWAGLTPCRTASRWQVRDNPQAWSGPDDCSMATRIAHDGKRLYLAIDVTDEDLVTEAARAWRRDGVEVFWDPRPAGRRGGAFAFPCRQLLIPVPPAGQAAKVQVNPASAVDVAQLQVACRRREGGYTLELAVPLSAVAEGFKASPGATLQVEVFANDKDAQAAETSCMVLSGDSNASRTTAGYATVTFE